MEKESGAMAPLKIIFAGTPEFARVHLAALLGSRHAVCAVYTQPDRPAGRGRKLQPSPVKQLALENNLPVFQPESLRSLDGQAGLSALKADLMIVVAYGLILPPAVLAAPASGCWNVHASLLPRWRGAAPIQRAIFAGDQETGVSIMQMAQGLDTGDVLSEARYLLLPQETAASLHDRLAHLGAQALLDTLDRWQQGEIVAQKQDDTHAIYAKKLSKKEAVIDWSQPAQAIEQCIRAFNPWPICETAFQGMRLRIWQASVVTLFSDDEPGTIVRLDKKGICVATGCNLLCIEKLQLPGGKVLSVADVCNGNKLVLTPGDRFSS
jgi:methionyl-tRNA formyltransferase